MKNKKWRVFLSKLSSGYHLFHCILFYTDGYSRCQQVNGFICIGIQHLADIHCLLYTRHCYRHLHYLLPFSKGRHLGIHQTYLQCVWVGRTMHEWHILLSLSKDQDWQLVYQVLFLDLPLSFCENWASFFYLYGSQLSHLWKMWYWLE